MNTSSTAEQQALAGSSTKYTQLPEGDLYFFDFASPDGTPIQYEGLRAHYGEKYPDFYQMCNEMEIVFQTFRAEYDRLMDLSVGFLHSVETRNFARWNQRAHQTWNRTVLTHHRVPQEFYDRLIAIGNAIQAEKPEVPHIAYPAILTRQNGHQSVLEAISDYVWVDVTEREIREILVPMGIKNLLRHGNWNVAKNGLFYINGKQVGIREFVLSIITQVMLVLMPPEDKIDPVKDERIIRVRPEEFFRGFEEVIDLALLLNQREYSTILYVLSSTKGKI